MRLGHKGLRFAMGALCSFFSVSCTYVADRGLDLVDCVGLEFYSGQGGLVNARATKVVQAGLGAFDGYTALLSKRAVGSSEEMRAEFGVGPYYYTAYDREVIGGTALYTELKGDEERNGLGHWNIRDKTDRGFYEVGASVAFFAGVGVHTDIYQILDFVFGFFYIDIARDDARNRDEPVIQDPRMKGIKERPVSSPRATDL